MESLRSIFLASAPPGADLEGILSLVGQELREYARVITGSEAQADDALQDLLVAVLEQGERLREIENPRAWLFTVLRRKAQAYRRRQPHSLALHLAAAVETDPADRVLLCQAFEELTEPQQEVVLLHLWEGLTFEEIGMVLNVPRNTVLSQYHRAVLKLRKKFGVERQEDRVNA